MTNETREDLRELLTLIVTLFGVIRWRSILTPLTTVSYFEAASPMHVVTWTDVYVFGIRIAHIHRDRR